MAATGKVVDVVKSMVEIRAMKKDLNEIMVVDPDLIKALGLESLLDPERALDIVDTLVDTLVEGLVSDHPGRVGTKNVLIRNKD
tara:strand:+ start:410 stop:661 length:252 start_codon:yes stop_codon:yes gene_type:complete